MTSTAYASVFDWSPEGPLLGSQAPVDPILAAEMAVLTDQGISSERAAQAIGVQGVIARTGLVEQVEAAMGSAFAGAWFEASRARLHIGVTSTASRRLAHAVIARAGLTPYVVETPVRSTWTQLLGTQTRWQQRLGKYRLLAQAKTSLNPQNNAVSIQLSSSVPATQLRTMEHESSRSDAKVEVESTPASQLHFTAEQGTACNHFLEEKANCDKTLTSGVIVLGKKKCTAGPLAMLQGSNKSATYVLTAGHCNPEGVGELQSAFNRAGTELEIGKVTNEVENEAGDYAAIQIENNAWKNAGPDPVLAVTAEWNTTENRSYPVIGERRPVQGNTSCHEGITTGHSCGLIKAVNVHDIVDEHLVAGLVEVHGDTLKHGAGDSGGPWMFIDSAKNAFMEGTHVAGSGSDTDYEPILTSLRSLKMELLTTSNELRADGFTWTGFLPGLVLALNQNAQVFTFAAEAEITCQRFKGHANLAQGTAMTSKEMTITGTYSSCIANNITAAEVSPVELLLNTDGSMAVGKPIVITVPLVGCSIKISNGGANGNLKTIKYLNRPTDILAHLEVSKITSLASGGLCGTAGEEKTGGSYRGFLLLSVDGGILRWG